MNKLTIEDGESLNITKENIDKLKVIFPTAFTEDGIDFDVLRQLLGDEVAIEEEKFRLSWHGKRKARQIASTPSRGTLRPCPEESVSWDNSRNLFIEGDNLEVLKLLQRSYAGKVKLIYIDPPYNTDGDFIYPDRYQDNLDTYLRYTGQFDDDGLKISSNTETSGRKHTNWINMMLPRLKLAHRLLSKNGILLCHIDEHEVSNLHYLLDEIFGQENCLGPIIWDKRNPKGDATVIATQHEYLLLYAKNSDVLKAEKSLKRPKANATRMLKKAAAIFAKKGSLSIPDDLTDITKKYKIPIDLNQYICKYDLEKVNCEYQNWLSRQSVSGGEAAYKYIDDDGVVYQSVSMAWPNKQQSPSEYRIPLKHPVTGKNCPIPEKGWRNPPKTMETLLKKNMILFGKDEKTQPRRKYILSDNMYENIPSVIPFGGSDDALLSALGIPFDNPKPVDFVMNMLRDFLSEDDTFIDFFSGSATTAHASMQICAERDMKIRFILVQLPEHFDHKKREHKTAIEFCKSIGKPCNISEIGKERIRRSIKKIRKAYPRYKGDLGFKVFRLDSSNIRAWNPDASNLKSTLLDHEEHIIEGRSEQDILYELLLKRGVELSTPIEERGIVDKTLYRIGGGELFACFAESITIEDTEMVGKEILAWYSEMKPESETHVFFLDSAFADDVVKSNMNAILDQGGINHIHSL